MKQFPRLLRLLLVTAALGTSASFAKDDPGVEHWKSAKRITKFTDAKKVTSKDLVTLQCQGCAASVMVDENHLATTEEGRAAWHAVGTSKPCSECKGDLTVVQGKDTNDLKVNCSKCGDDKANAYVSRSKDKEEVQKQP